MEYELTTGDYGKMMRELALVPVIFILIVAITAILISFGFKPPGWAIPIGVFTPVLFFILRLRGTYRKEKILLEADKIVSSGLGKIEFKDIAHYKILAYGGAETLIITLYSKQKLAFSKINAMTTQAWHTWVEFKEKFQERMELENTRREEAGKVEVMKRRSLLSYYMNVFIVVSLGFVDIYVLAGMLSGKHFSDSAFLKFKIIIANLLLAYSIITLIRNGKNS